ncbi:Uncharacterised protein [Yersinia similis]|uniref:Uncharacterized protein n=1 Tax=Yersinia similis TaxID=367190 RepID=A0A0T9NVG6_9GAMM|nr:Uncharacterised protein [Yersinia similis]CNB08405.1 Uncharacterised protein [Yersinia similis]CNF00008.1 Uncharacterised protein [Yersinia similis]CNF03351.1 Uncharacterised protein [Yersinia similis]CNH30264.1 Uncharacterised protein [Yersinia similis]
MGDTDRITFDNAKHLEGMNACLIFTLHLGAGARDYGPRLGTDKQISS